MSQTTGTRRPPFLIAMPILGGCMLLALLLLILARVVVRPAEWHAQLDYYLQYQGGWTYVSATKAVQPDQFAPAMSGPTYGNSQVYQTDFGYTGRVIGAKPLLYPPDEVWCVTLRAQDNPSSERLVFVARHSDINSTDWVTHEPAGDPVATQARIGCH